MKMGNLIYDIRTSEKAQETLCRLTGVPMRIWEESLGREREYRYVDDFVEEIVSLHGNFPSNYEDFDFIYFHVTTSKDNCVTFKKYGILNLRESYLCLESELRIFLERHGVHIDLDNKTLTYNGKAFDITYSPRVPWFGTEEYKCWCVGSKFYFDYTTCGFLSVREWCPYGGYVHQRPEILEDIDNLLKLNLSHEWMLSHTPYEVVAKVSGTKIVYSGDDDQSDYDKVLGYITKAYQNAFGEPAEEIILLKNDLYIPPADIIEIKPLECWTRY